MMSALFECYVQWPPCRIPPVFGNETSSLDVKLDFLAISGVGRQFEVSVSLRIHRFISISDHRHESAADGSAFLVGYHSFNFAFKLRKAYSRARVKI